ncbi:hypothetical protein MGG_10074 [Pyricularia oryzae 70-15]|uniref:Uncharacterized protein n=3 Tax=Pyricularia oryzae TaxID=318829 RepID=G4N915_PYRO7|nr:uncharacterized protein MGG_10074 [Pyricularia oryzae 70-15]ELQ32866.1 hypothetical protein OOU_Y34scaffold01019g4 [Pyricularia oryzae Y34]KAI6295849.1 hypothetical protein MCOR34_009552 [Pyricularia oryzae]EHA51110.1 hypothetical protein MGG_10074 [Pyricularia oryzae 70-15]KAI6455591.1 hypothetical protein MCOR17_008611 [Pyricularia oryzae]KAI6485477.1 hypothetical protein MCOR13_009683 [Pyricularia oryzae]
MQFFKIQLFTLLAAVGSMASSVAPVDSLSLPLTEAAPPAESAAAPAAPAAATDAPGPDYLAPSNTISLGLFGSKIEPKKNATLGIVIKNCEARTTKVECEKIFSGCKWLRASAYCVDK